MALLVEERSGREVFTRKEQKILCWPSNKRLHLISPRSVGVDDQSLICIAVTKKLSFLEEIFGSSFSNYL